ncbi:c-type cytochrome domain-containing protein [Verrucomicrobium spinosum]|uniref:c-type cytochrome domain-containing protein n=1 Tax=Verrucomicrobium spinosum TaxID=2736 RepID=UPI000AA4A483|nr:c-type cytochrome domain-containing protein [Verrucomicrobium spinosum]
MLALSVAPLAAAEEGMGKVRFNEQIRPILSDMCFHCHGPDDKTRDADLRLDTREGALENGAVVPGKPDESELMVRILSHDRSEMMPPPKAKKPSLTEAQVATFRRWIEQGAEYEGTGFPAAAADATPCSQK